MEVCKQLVVFERKMLRRILGAVSDGGNRRRRYNELMTMYGELHIVSSTRVRRLRWIGHVSRMMKRDRKLYQVRVSYNL